MSNHTELIAELGGKINRALRGEGEPGHPGEYVSVNEAQGIVDEVLADALEAVTVPTENASIQWAPSGDWAQGKPENVAQFLASKDGKVRGYAWGTGLGFIFQTEHGPIEVQPGDWIRRDSDGSFAVTPGTVPTENEREAAIEQVLSESFMTRPSGAGVAKWAARSLVAAGFRLPVPVEENKPRKFTPEQRAELIDFAQSAIQSVWDDVGATSAEDLAGNVVSAQEFAWLSMHFPVAVPVEPETKRARAIQANEIAHLVIAQAKAALPGFFVPLSFRYGIAEALWDLGYRRTGSVAPDEITKGEKP